LALKDKVKLSEYDFTDLQNYPNVGKNKAGELEEFSFMGNYMLRNAICKLAMTAEAKTEKQKCAESYEYFIENYVKIQTIDHGITAFKLRPFQYEYLKLVHENQKIISKIARQVGKTISTCSYLVWCLCFKEDFTIGVVANTSPLTLEIVSIIKQMFELLPAFLRPGVKSWGAASIRLANGNRIISAVAGPSALRGRTLNVLLIDEAGHIDENKMKPFFDSVMPALSSGTKTKIIIISTPKGFNTFQRIFAESQKGINGYVNFEGTWRVVPGRDEAWKQKQIETDGLESFLQNHEVQFLGSSKTLLSKESLERILVTKRLPIDTLSHIHEDCKVYLYPVDDPDVFYTVGADSAKISMTSNRNSDYISVHVLEFNRRERTIKQAMVLKTRDMHYLELSELLYEIGSYYNDALVLVENNSGDGQSTVDTLFDKYEYENVFRDSSRSDINGFRTTTKSKRVGLSNLKQLIDKDILEVYDIETIDEFFTFVKIGNTYRAMSAEVHDDAVMALTGGLQFLNDELNEMGMTIWDFFNELEADEDGTFHQISGQDRSSDDLDMFVTSRTQQSKEDLRWLLGSN